jgi:hypothetical protein
MPLASNFPLKDYTLTIVVPEIDKVDGALPDEALREQLLYEIGVQKAKLAERVARNLKVLYGSI